MTQQYRLASMAAWLSSTGISHLSLLPHIPSIHLSAVNNSPRPGIAPQSLNSSFQLLHLSGGPASLSGVCMAVARTVSFSFCLGCHRSAVSLSASNVSSLTQTIAPMWGSDPCFSSPTRRGQVQSYEHSCFPPSFFVLPSFRGSMYSFPLVRHACLLSAAVLLALFVSEGVFLMYPWREMNSTSSYSSAI